MITLGDDLDVSAIWGHDLEIHHETFDLSTKTHLLGLNGYPRFTTDVTYYICNKTRPGSISGLTLPSSFRSLHTLGLTIITDSL